ncbi:transcription antitermination factor NusB [Candidatus Daviesbacteria bacterium]|nr:transcription antitermination factor NusB [Candidatus Daviesbacteria bacterium]
MKTAKDPRHIKRIKLLKELFSWQFMPKDKTSKNIKEITANIQKVDKLIGKSAPGRPIEQINKIDLAILRLAVFELIIKVEAPPKVVIDEAVELGKEFGAESSASFINGALGKLVEIKKIHT